LQVLRLWEAMWAAPPRHFHMWMVFAVLQHHRKPLMQAATDYDGLLKFCIQVPMQQFYVMHVKMNLRDDLCFSRPSC
jgi:hypothetical protein